jgi:hypothetical protein
VTSVGTLSTATITTLTTTTVNASGAVTLTYPSSSGAALLFNPSSTQTLVTIKDTALVVVQNVALTKTALVLDVSASALCKIGGVGMDVWLGDCASPIATNATKGFPTMPTMAGTASEAVSGGMFYYDATNNKIGVYNSGWRWTAALT